MRAKTGDPIRRPRASSLVLQTPTIQQRSVQPRPAQRAAPTFFRGLVFAFPVATAMWIAMFLAVRADI